MDVKRRAFGLISVLIGVLLALASVEIMATVWLTIEDGRYNSAAALFGRTDNTFVKDVTKETGCRYVDSLFPHPYVAFVHRTTHACAGQMKINNVGLFGEDYPTTKRADRYTILLVGGSVASQLGQPNPPPARRYLEEELNQHYVSPNGKPFLVLNGGDGAWKQPQSFILFALNVGVIDGVVALDGFNEHLLFLPGRSWRLEQPASNFVAVNPLVSQESFGDAAIGWMIGRAAGVLRNTPLLDRSHAVYMIVRGLEASARRQQENSTLADTTLDGFYRLPDSITKDPDKLFRFQLDLYQRYTRGIETMALSNGVRTAFFLQPIPGYGKTLTEDERRDAGDLSHTDLYRRMVAGMMTLRERGLPMFDLGDIYRDEKGRIYADAIHCYWEPTGTADSRGYAIMANRMAADLAQAWGLQRKLQSSQ